MNDSSPSSYTGLGSKHMGALRKGGRNWLIFKVKKEEIKVQLLSRLHKACRKLPPLTRLTLLCWLLNFYLFTLFIPTFHFSRPLQETWQGEMGISRRIEAELNHRLQKPVRWLARPQCNLSSHRDPRTIKPVCAVCKRSFLWRCVRAQISQWGHPALFSMSLSAKRGLPRAAKVPSIRKNARFLSHFPSFPSLTCSLTSLECLCLSYWDTIQHLLSAGCFCGTKQD